jgi:hypothetical protein
MSKTARYTENITVKCLINLCSFNVVDLQNLYINCQQSTWLISGSQSHKLICILLKNISNKVTDHRQICIYTFYIMNHLYETYVKSKLHEK